MPPPVLTRRTALRLAAGVTRPTGGSVLQLPNNYLPILQA